MASPDPRRACGLAIYQRSDPTDVVDVASCLLQRNEMDRPYTKGHFLFFFF